MNENEIKKLKGKIQWLKSITIKHQGAKATFNLKHLDLVFYSDAEADRWIANFKRKKIADWEKEVPPDQLRYIERWKKFHNS